MVIQRVDFDDSELLSMVTMTGVPAKMHLEPENRASSLPLAKSSSPILISLIFFNDLEAAAANLSGQCSVGRP